MTAAKGEPSRRFFRRPMVLSGREKGGARKNAAGQGGNAGGQRGGGTGLSTLKGGGPSGSGPDAAEDRIFGGMNR